MSLSTCTACGGLVPRLASACPHCEAPCTRRRSTARKLFDLAGGGAVALTLSACYGAAPGHYEPATPTSASCDPSRDVDGDGFCEDDCDQASAAMYPGADDPAGDALDQNCDGIDGVAPDPASAPDAVIAEP